MLNVINKYMKLIHLNNIYFSDYLATFSVENNIPSIAKFCADRYNGVMDTGPKFKYTNIFTSLIASYVVGVMVSWSDIMNDYRVFSNYYGLYFVVFILVVVLTGTFFQTA